MKPALDLHSCTDCHCLAARRLARELTRAYDARLRPHGLRATQFSVLVALAATGGAPMNRLADALGMERTTLTRSVAILERRGWVRSGSASDARERRLQLTPAGRRKLEAAYPAWKSAQRDAARKLSQEV
jgi:DNA-binding MarR family transcriptional regulator